MQGAAPHQYTFPSQSVNLDSCVDQIELHRMIFWPFPLFTKFSTRIIWTALQTPSDPNMLPAYAKLCLAAYCNTLFCQQFNLRYSELLDTIHHVLFDKMDKRLYDYLKKKILLTNKNPIKISHRQIATELGTAREVISRVMKKLENEGKLKQHTNSIELL